MLSNSGNIIVFKNGPADEELLLPFLEPEVEKGAIINLPLYHFFMKVTNSDNEDAFSGETILMDKKGSNKVAQEIIDYSRKQYATPRKVVERQLNKLFGVEETETVKKPSAKPHPGKTKEIKPKTKDKDINFAAQNSFIKNKKRKNKKKKEAEVDEENI